MFGKNVQTRMLRFSYCQRRATRQRRHFWSPRLFPPDGVARSAEGRFSPESFFKNLGGCVKKPPFRGVVPFALISPHVRSSVSISPESKTSKNVLFTQYHNINPIKKTICARQVASKKQFQVWIVAFSNVSAVISDSTAAAAAPSICGWHNMTGVRAAHSTRGKRDGNRS